MLPIEQEKRKTKNKHHTAQNEFDRLEFTHQH